MDKRQRQIKSELTLFPEVKQKRDDERGTRQSVNFTQRACAKKMTSLTEVSVSTLYSMNLLHLSRLRTAGKLVLALARGYEKAALTSYINVIYKYD